MAKKTFMIAGILLMSLLASSCGQQEENKENVRRTEKDVSVERAAEDSFTGTSTAEASTNNILIAYFTRIDNTDADLDEIVQGGGPYGEIGGSLEEAEADALSSASITVYQGHPGGNTEALAQMIQKITGGTLFSI